VGSAALVVVVAGASAGLAAFAGFASSGDLLGADFRSGLVAFGAARFSSRVSAVTVAGAATGVAFLPPLDVLVIFVSVVAAGGVSLFWAGAVAAAAFADLPAFAPIRVEAGAEWLIGAIARASFLGDTTATSVVILTVLRGAVCFAGTRESVASFSGIGLRALLAGAFAAMGNAFLGMAGVVKALEAVDFAVFFVVNL